MNMKRHNSQRVGYMFVTMCGGLALAMAIAVEPSQAQQKLDTQLQRATTEYKSNLEQLLTLYEGEAKRAEAQLANVKELLAQGLVTRSELETAEDSATRTREKVAEVQAQFKSADVLVAEVLVEADAEESTRKIRSSSAPRTVNTLVQTTAYIRYGSAHPWSLSDASVIQQFFARRFGRALPIDAFGQSALHNRWGYDHRNAMDVGLSPDAAEGQALMEYLRTNGIPFTAFHFAVPGKATGPHIHIGLPSHRIAPASLAANAGNTSRQ
jgi:hypothetical protein